MITISITMDMIRILEYPAGHCFTVTFETVYCHTSNLSASLYKQIFVWYVCPMYLLSPDGCTYLNGTVSQTLPILRLLYYSSGKVSSPINCVTVLYTTATREEPPRKRLRTLCHDTKPIRIKGPARGLHCSASFFNTRTVTRGSAQNCVTLQEDIYVVYRTESG